MKEKIIAEFKRKFPAVNLSNARIEALASKLETKITDEAQIGLQLDALNDAFDFTEIAKQDDKIRNFEANKKPETKIPTTEEKKPETTVVTQTNDAVPEWAKSLVESNRKLSEQLLGFQREKQQSSIKTTLKTKLEKIAPEEFWNEWNLPEKEEDIDPFVDKVKTKYEGFAKKATEDGLTIMGVPGAARGGANSLPGGNGQATDKEVESIVKNIM